MKYAFISRHMPTASQYKLANEKGIELIPVGDMDAFNEEEIHEWIRNNQSFKGVIVVHPALALEFYKNEFDVGVFQNVNRAEEGQPPKFEAGSLKIWYYEYIL